MKNSKRERIGLAFSVELSYSFFICAHNKQWTCLEAFLLKKCGYLILCHVPLIEKDLAYLEKGFCGGDNENTEVILVAQTATPSKHRL